MQLHTIGIDLGKTVFHLVGLNLRGEVVVRKKFSRKATAAFHGEPAGSVDWHGSLWWVPLSRAGSERARSRGTADAGAVRQAVRKDEQERLH
jgi:hypothetical protein